MSQQYIRITVPMLRDDYRDLTNAAAKEYREPRQHAAWLLRQALDLTSDQESTDKTQNGIGAVRQDLATNAVL